MKRNGSPELAFETNEDIEERNLYLNQRVGCLRFHCQSFICLIDKFLKSDFLLDPLFEAASGTANQANLSKTDLMNLLGTGSTNRGTRKDTARD